jgi:hypothetical protein
MNEKHAAPFLEKREIMRERNVFRFALAVAPIAPSYSVVTVQANYFAVKGASRNGPIPSLAPRSKSKALSHQTC